jgi:hypothetical protein
LSLAKESIDAEEFLREHAGEMTADQLYDAVLKVSDSKTAAEKAFMARRKAELKSGNPVKT